MALIVCPECKKEISNQADICPNCGYKIATYVQNIRFVDEFMSNAFDPYEVFVGQNKSCVSNEMIDTDSDLKLMVENDIEFVSFEDIIPKLGLQTNKYCDRYEVYELETIRTYR